ncbi:MAG: four helix bundle protein [Bacteroidetes bacterium]|nr:four helix bundle protein [Bacteroidota bacterium]
MKKENLILNRTFDFSIVIIGLYKTLIGKKEYVLSKQILRSGTSIGANVEEATAAFSKNDFAYKMSVASKEARETRYWLKLLQKSQLVKGNYEAQLSEVDELINILTAIVKTVQSKEKR